MKQGLAIVLMLVFYFQEQNACSQSKDEEIKRLQKLVKENEDRAIRAERMAKQYLAEANQAKERLERLRLYALAKAFAIKSLELEDKQQAGLEALTALNFIRKGDGYEVENDIYASLVGALTRYDRFPQSLKFNSETVKFIRENSNIAYVVTNQNQLVSWTNTEGTWKPDELTKIKNRNITAFDVAQSGKQIIMSIADNKGYGIKLFETYLFRIIQKTYSRVKDQLIKSNLLQMVLLFMPLVMMAIL